MAGRDPFPLPRGWTKRVRSSVLHAVSLAFVALTRAWAAAATLRLRRRGVATRHLRQARPTVIAA